MRILILVFLVISNSTLSFGQIQIPDLQNSVTDVSNFNIPAVLPLLKKSEVIILYGTYSAWGKGPFKIISFQNDHIWHAYLLTDSLFDHDVITYNMLTELNCAQDS